MGRPKKVVPPQPDINNPLPEEIEVKVEEPIIEQKIEEAIAPPPKAEVQEPVYVVERQGEIGSIAAKKLPTIYAGVCEFCGPGEYDHSSPQRQVRDDTVHPETQKGKCVHYNGVVIRCSYCPLNADWVDNIRHRTHMVWESPWNPKQLIILCSDMTCRDKHVKRSMTGRI